MMGAPEGGLTAYILRQIGKIHIGAKLWLFRNWLNEWSPTKNMRPRMTSPVYIPVHLAASANRHALDPSI